MQNQLAVTRQKSFNLPSFTSYILSHKIIRFTLTDKYFTMITFYIPLSILWMHILQIINFICTYIV